MSAIVTSSEPQKQRRANPRRFLAVGFGLLLALPMLQMAFPVVHEIPLGGVESKLKRPRFSLKSWSNGSTAQRIEAWTARRIGFRSILVRVANQCKLAFGATPASLENESVVVCRDNWLVEENYVARYTDPPCSLSENDVADFVADLKELQDRLRARGAAMVLVISPSKAETYPEYLPAWARDKRKAFQGETDVERLRRRLASSGVVVFDTPRYFQQRKQSVTENCYTKTGTHWNYFTAFHVWRNILQLVNREYGADWPIPEQTGVEFDAPRGTDDDIAKLLNVLYLPGVENHVPYPIVRTNALPFARRPDVLFAGTSFSQTLVNSMYLSESGRECDYLFYTSKHFTRRTPAKPVRGGTEVVMRKEHIDGLDSIDWQSTLFDKEIVVLELLDIYVDEQLHGFHKAALAELRRRDGPDRLAVNRKE